MDPWIALDLDLRLLPPVEIRLRWMGLLLPPFDRERERQELAQTAFVIRLLHGPWAQVVRRREEARHWREYFAWRDVAWIYNLARLDQMLHDPEVHARLDEEMQTVGVIRGWY